MQQRAIIFILLGILLFTAGASLAAPLTPKVESTVKKDFARILFSSSERLPFKTRMDGRVLKITFDQATRPDLGSITSSLSPYVESAAMAADGRTALITLRQPYPVRTFITGNASGIDLLQIRSPRFNQPGTPPSRPATQVAAATPPPPSKAAAPGKDSSPRIAPQPKPAAPPKPQPAQAAAPAPDAPPPPAEEPARTAALKEKTPANVAAAETTETSGASPKEVASAQDAAALTPSAAKPATAEPAILPGAPVAKPAEEKPAESTEKKATKPQDTPTVERVAAPKEGKGLMVTVEKRKISADLHFPWKERVAAAAFIYGQDAWITFSQPAQVDIAALRGVLPPFISNVEQLVVPNATVLRFSLSDPMSLGISKSADSYEWAFSFSRRSKVPSSPIIAETSTKPPLKPYIFLPVLEATEPVTLTHPLTQDEMVVLPIYKAGQGVFPERSFVDARLPRTAQGVLIVKNSSNLRIVKLRNGVRLTAPQGVLLSDALPPLQLDAYLSGEEGADSFFPYELWKVPDEAGLVAREQSLRREITQASDPRASRLRRQLAELYLGNGLYLEALGVLNLIRDTDSEYYTNYQLAALRGAANFMADRIDEAAIDFADGALDDEEEIEFWRRVTALMRGQESKPLKYDGFHRQYARNYPPEFRRRLALIAADQAIGRQQYAAALHIMETLDTKELIEPVQDYRDFMIGRIYAESGKPEKAEEVLTKLLEKTDDRFIQARARFTLATTQYEANKITKEELMKQLDALRIVWRGDQLELSLLELLGELYVGEGDYVKGLRAWKELLTHYPNAPAATDIAARMSDTFVKLFNEGKAGNLPPVSALALYYEFRDLTPIGPEGDKMIQQLADRLAAVDLLDRAASLLEHQVMYRLEKEERSRVGARLALIYLLNKQPEEAIKVLELTGYGNNEESLQNQRDRLAAMAYADTGDTKTALAMLEDDFTRDAKLVRLDIYWDNKDWPNVITTGEELLASRSDITAPLNEEESRTLMRLAIAYSFTNDRLQLQYLRDYFTPLMAESNYKDSFDFITDDKGPIDPQNIQELAQDMSRTKSFLENYRTSIAEKGLSSSIN